MALDPDKIPPHSVLVVAEIVAKSHPAAPKGFALLETYRSCNGPRMRVVAVYQDRAQAEHYMLHPEAFTLEGFS